VDREVAQSGEGVAGISGHTKPGVQFTNSLLPRLAEPDGRPLQIDEFRPHGAPGVATFEEMEAPARGKPT
jgi:hypothetical protein